MNTDSAAAAAARDLRARLGADRVLVRGPAYDQARRLGGEPDGSHGTDAEPTACSKGYNMTSNEGTPGADGGPDPALRVILAVLDNLLG